MILDVHVRNPTSEIRREQQYYTELFIIGIELRTYDSLSSQVLMMSNTNVKVRDIYPRSRILMDIK